MDVEVNLTLPSSRPRTSEQGYTLNELCVLLATFAVIVGLAVPGMLRMRSQSRNEASAIKQLHIIAASQAAYARSCGAGGYAIELGVLRSQTSSEVGEMQSPRQKGYDFALGVGAGSVAGPMDCHGTPTRTAYLATARPVEFGIAGTGKRSFAITGNRTLWQTKSALPPDEPFGAPETPLQ